MQCNAELYEDIVPDCITGNSALYYTSLSTTGSQKRKSYGQCGSYPAITRLPNGESWTFLIPNKRTRSTKFRGSINKELFKICKPDRTIRVP